MTPKWKQRAQWREASLRYYRSEMETKEGRERLAARKRFRRRAIRAEAEQITPELLQHIGMTPRPKTGE